MILGISWESWIAWLIAAYLLRSAVLNWQNPKFIKDDYERWGFPRWFHRFNAGFLIGAALLLIPPQTRLAGLVMAVVLCVGIFATLIRYREYALMRNAAMLFAATCICAIGRLGLA